MAVCPFAAEMVRELKDSVIAALEADGWILNPTSEDRTEVPIDFSNFDLLLRSSDETDISLDDFARGVRVGPRTRMPRLLEYRRLWRVRISACGDDGKRYRVLVDSRRRCDHQCGEKAFEEMVDSGIHVIHE